MQTITNEQLFEKLSEVEALLLNKSKFEQGSIELVSAHEIADYLGYSYEHAKRAVMADPRFPPAVEFMGRTGGKTANRWIAGDEVQFVIAMRRRKMRN